MEIIINSLTFLKSFLLYIKFKTVKCMDVPAGIVSLTLPKAMYNSDLLLITHPIQPVQSLTVQAKAKNRTVVE